MDSRGVLGKAKVMPRSCAPIFDPRTSMTHAQECHPLNFLKRLGSANESKSAVAPPRDPRRSEAAVTRKRVPGQQDPEDRKKEKPDSEPDENPRGALQTPALQLQPSGSGSLGDSFLKESEQYDGPFRRVKPGDRPKSILITWSDTKKGAYRRPSTKQEFMKIVGDVLQEAQDTKCGPQSTVNLKGCQVAIFEELHADLTRHLHCMVAFPEKTSVGSYVGTLLLKRSIATDVRGPAASSGATPAAHRFLAYCMTPSEEKWLTDDAPLLYNLQVPLSISDAAARAQKRLSKKPADIDALYCFLAQNPEIVKPEQFDATLNSHCYRRSVHKNYHIPYTRLRLLASKLGRTFPEEFHAQLNRIRAQRVDPRAPYSGFYEDAIRSECECKKPGDLLARVIDGGGVPRPKRVLPPDGGVQILTITSRGGFRPLDPRRFPRPATGAVRDRRTGVGEKRRCYATPQRVPAGRRGGLRHSRSVRLQACDGRHIPVYRSAADGEVY